jgi:hypothetical protein
MVSKAKLDVVAQDKTARAFNSVQGRMQKLTGGIGRLTAVMGGLVGAAGLGRLVKTSLASADALGKLAKQTGFTAEQLQKYQFAAGQGGGYRRRVLTPACRHLLSDWVN